jgi:hypothetical protein
MCFIWLLVLTALGNCWEGCKKHRVYACVNVQPWKLHYMQCGQMLRIWLRNRIISHSYGATSAHFHGRGSVAVCTKLDTPEPIAFEELCILY